MAPYRERYRLKHRKQGDYSPDSTRNPTYCHGFCDEEKKDGEYHEAMASLLFELNKRSSHFQDSTLDQIDQHPPLHRIVVLSTACLAILVVTPLVIFDGYPRQWGPYILLRHLELAWSSMLHISMWHVVWITVVCVMTCPMKDVNLVPQSFLKYFQPKSQHLAHFTSTVASYHWKVAFLVSLILFQCLSSQVILQMAIPSLLWNPAIWAWYRVYLPQDVAASAAGGCFTKLDGRERHETPLCLDEKQWKELSSGTLSSYNSEDVETVIRGLDYIQNFSGGFIINALARNVAKSIPALRENIEGLLPFLDGKDLSLVIFENDSIDGTREDLKEWAKEVNGQSRYNVDLISCGENNPDCHLNIMERYENMPSFSNPNASGVGKLGDFRQIVMNHILNTPVYDNYSHMIVLDVDIGTSISPLGLLHTLGLNDAELSQKYVVASASVQVWPGTFGTIIPPYDFSAFRPLPTERNERLRKMHQYFCELMPAGDRWRNMCEATSPMQLFLVQSNNDEVVNHGNRPYEVSSAFNGMAIYPMSLIREKGDLAHYDAGDDNQRCEHVGFNLSLQNVMYINPKWKMNLKPNKPGGPTGFLVTKTILLTFAARLPVLAALFIGNWMFLLVFVTSIWMIGFSVKRAHTSACPKAGDNWWDDKGDGTV